MNNLINIFKIDMFYGEEVLHLRPEVSYKVKEYIEQLFLNELLLKRKIIVGSKLSTLLQVNFFVNEDKEYIVSLPPTVYKKEQTKAYPIMVSYSDYFQESKNVNLDFCYLLFKIISEFLLSNFKRIKIEDITDLKNKIDIEYLSAIPYPAPFNEQKFVGDDSSISRSYFNSNNIAK